MEFRLLGSLEVRDGGREVSVPGAKRRALLAILLLHRNQVVTRDRLIDLLWGERPPSSALHALDVHVSNLRSRLPDGGQCLHTRPGGFLLQVEPGALDLERFEQLAASGHAALAEGRPEAAAEDLGEALALIHGPVLAEFAFQPFAQAAISRFDEARAVALEDLLDAELALGRHDEIIG